MTGDKWPMTSDFRTMTRSRGAAEGRNTWASKRPSSARAAPPTSHAPAEIRKAVIRLMTYLAGAAGHERRPLPGAARPLQVALSLPARGSRISPTKAPPPSIRLLLPNPFEPPTRVDLGFVLHRS